MKRGLVFAKYPAIAASTRQRFLQAAPYLQACGVSIEVHPLFDEQYLQRLYRDGRRSALNVLGAYGRRVADLLTSRSHDFVWLHCELFPYLPAFAERLISVHRKPIVYDFDDAVFHQYDNHRSALVRAVLGKKLQPVLRRSSLAFCGSAYLQLYADRYAPRTVLIPTTVDVKAYQPAPAPAPRQPGGVTIGWIGSPSTWPYCEAIADVLEAHCAARSGNAVLVVGAQKGPLQRGGFEFRDWAESREVADIQQMDIGIMPMPDEPWARGKCGFKLIQYMACGLPVVASPVGANVDIVQEGVTGLFASTPQQWRDALARLAGDAALRQRMGEAARRHIVDHYSIQRYGPVMGQLFQSL